MKTKAISFAHLLLFLLAASLVNAQPSIELFKQVFEKQLQVLKPDGTTKRTIKFADVQADKSNGGYYRFIVTAYVHDYGAGYPANRYYGQTCVGKMDKWPFDMLKNDQGQWIVQGRFTVSGSDHTCKDNIVQGTSSIPIASVPGTIYEPGVPIQYADNTKQLPSLYIGEYACYGTGGRLLGGMGFILLPDKTYYDLDKKRGGTYTFNSEKASISFKGGFLDAQVGTDVKTTGFQLSGTIRCEPWR